MRAIPEPWGGHANGRIPRSELRRLRHATGPTGDPADYLYLRRDASLALDRLLLMAADDGHRTYITDAYRDYDTQVRLKQLKGRYAATPGTSNHGWGMAADCAYSASSDSFGRWLWALRDLAREHGWYPPAWTHDGAGIEEPWHWEYDDALDRHHGEDPEDDDMKPDDWKRLDARLDRAEKRVIDAVGEALADRVPANLKQELDGLRRGVREALRRAGATPAEIDKLGV